MYLLLFCPARRCCIPAVRGMIPGRPHFTSLTTVTSHITNNTHITWVSHSTNNSYKHIANNKQNHWHRWQQSKPYGSLTTNLYCFCQHHAVTVKSLTTLKVKSLTTLKAQTVQCPSTDIISLFCHNLVALTLTHTVRHGSWWQEYL